MLSGGMKRLMIHLNKDYHVKVHPVQNSIDKRCLRLEKIQFCNNNDKSKHVRIDNDLRALEP